MRNRAPEDDFTWRSRWTELLDHLDDWYHKRPEEMKPIFTIPAPEDGQGSPFPTILYGNGPAVSGNQLYHTATLLMLQEKPNGLQVQRKQPLWIAGKVMSHPSEHRAIVNILERIQRETGWQTSWRREDLETWWGDSDD
ncbi:hypothetical protein DH86_00004015 [Scytalidium sp. 3C]|nr:hypothetical protein DH86_00004015 [Scytalidium sp. 3C]